jgi:septum formation protein
MPSIVLASTSRYRRQLMERLQVPFEVVSPNCDEERREGESAADLVVRLAEAKARSVAGQHPGALVIGSDQVAALADRVLVKPGSHERAVEQLRACSGRTVVFHTGLCLVDAESGAARIECIDCAVRFRALDEVEIERYLRRDQPYDCAGSIRSEGYAVTLFESMEAPDPTALVGLPLILLGGTIVVLFVVATGLRGTSLR